MCSHAEHRVEVLPDGQIAEEHLLADKQMMALQDSINRLLWTLEADGTVVFGEVFPDGKSWISP